MHQHPPAPNAFNHSDSEQTRTQTRTETDTGTVVPIPPGTELLALQIQAFLRASQDEELDGDVEIDEEIVKDILSVLSGSRLRGDDGGEDGVSVDEQLGIMEEESDGDDSDGTGDLMRPSCEGERGSRDVLEGQIGFLFRIFGPCPQLVNVNTC